MFNLSLSHINMMHSSMGASFLDQFTSESNSTNKQSFIVSLNEPPMRKDKITYMSNFSLYYKQTGSNKPRAAIATRGKGFKVLFLEKISDSDVAVAQIILDNGIKFYFISLYLPPNGVDFNNDDLFYRLNYLSSFIFGELNRYDIPIVLCSDTNSRCVELGEYPNNYLVSSNF